MEPVPSRTLSMSTDWDAVFAKPEQSFDADMQFTTVPLTHFLTRSSYAGEWYILGMSGFGTYTFAHGVEYEGNFRDGVFHGDGTLKYPMGQKLHGIWESGKLISWKYQFKDGLEFDETFSYCKYPDRRFYATIKDGLNPAGKERLTNDVVPRKIPPMCYDAGDGYYHPGHKCVQSVHDENKILRIPSKKESDWIVKNCRKAWDEPTGYKPELYPNWTTVQAARGMKEPLKDFNAINSF